MVLKPPTHKNTFLCWNACQRLKRSTKARVGDTPVPHHWPLAHPVLSYKATQISRSPCSTPSIAGTQLAMVPNPPRGVWALWLVPTGLECLSGEFAQQPGQRHIKDSLPGCSQPGSAFLLEDSVGSLCPETQLCKTAAPSQAWAPTH